MGHTNSTPNIGLPQFIGTDKPTWLGDVNGAMSAIDTKVGSIDAAIATTDAKADNAVADASGAVTTATNAVNTAGAASTTATQANNLATQALTVANNTADLCTQSIVPSVTANTNAIGTLADLTTTDKSNLVNAINEVAQGGGGGSAFDLDLIWTNPDDTQAQPAGSVASLTDQPAYKAFIITARKYTGGDEFVSAVAFAGLKNMVVAGDPSASVFRDVTITQTGSAIDVTVSLATAGGSTNQTNLVISKIYGMK